MCGIKRGYFLVGSSCHHLSPKSAFGSRTPATDTFSFRTLQSERPQCEHGMSSRHITIYNIVDWAITIHSKYVLLLFNYLLTHGYVKMNILNLHSGLYHLNYSYNNCFIILI